MTFAEIPLSPQQLEHLEQWIEDDEDREADGQWLADLMTGHDG